MSELFSGMIEVQNTAESSIRVTINGDTADLSAGGNGQAGDLVLRDSVNNERIRIGTITETGGGSLGSEAPSIIARYWGLRVRTAEGQNVIQLGRIESHQDEPPQQNPPDVVLIIGSKDQAGSLTVQGLDGERAAILDKEGAKIHGGSVLFLQDPGTNRGRIGFGSAGHIFSEALPDSLAIRSEAAIHMGVQSSIAMTIREVGYGPGNGYVGIGTSEPTCQHKGIQGKYQ